MQASADSTVENEGNCAAEGAEDNAVYCLTPGFVSRSSSLKDGDTNQVSPTANIAAGASHPCALRASENQNPSIVKALHVRLSIGVTSMSTFVLIPVSLVVDSS